MKVLIVEDEPALREALADYLPEHGIEPELASSGEEGLEQAQLGPHDAIILDVRLPGIDGFETCRRLARLDIPRHTPVVFLTARADQKDKIEGFEAGGVDYLTKPFQLEELVTRLRYHVDRARTEQALRDANERLQLETERLDRVLSITAHDLGGPLEGLGLVLTMLRDHEEQRTDASIDTLLSTVAGLRKLLDDLLVWARTGAAGFHPESRPVQVWAVARRNLEVVKTMAQNKGVTLDAKVSAHIWAHTDRNMLDTVVRNLVINAVKFTDREGTVTVRASRNEEEVLISVVDDGIGIPPDRLESLLEPGRGESTPGTRGELGSGLGLALARKMVDVLGGRLWVESTPGEGSQFHVALPAVPSGAQTESTRKRNNK